MLDIMPTMIWTRVQLRELCFWAYFLQNRHKLTGRDLWQRVSHEMRSRRHTSEKTCRCKYKQVHDTDALVMEFLDVHTQRYKKGLEFLEGLYADDVQQNILQIFDLKLVLLLKKGDCGQTAMILDEHLKNHGVLSGQNDWSNPAGSSDWSHEYFSKWGTKQAPTNWSELLKSRR